MSRDIEQIVSDVPHIWKNERAFLSWLRSAARRTWSKHPIKNEYKRARRYKAPLGRVTKKSPEGMVWVSDCEMCGEQSRSCEVDHIESAGSFTTVEEWKDWMEKLLVVGFDDVRELCKDCHEAVTLTQKQGMSLEEAFIEKEVIKLCKMKAGELREYLKERGYSQEDVSNATKRKKCVRGVLRNNYE